MPLAGVVRPEETEPRAKAGAFSWAFPESRGQREPSAGPPGCRRAGAKLGPLLCGNSRRNRPDSSAPMAKAAIGDARNRWLRPAPPRSRPHTPSQPQKPLSWPAPARGNARGLLPGLVAGGQHDENRRAQLALAGSRMGATIGRTPWEDLQSSRTRSGRPLASACLPGNPRRRWRASSASAKAPYQAGFQNARRRSKPLRINWLRLIAQWQI